MVASVAGRRRHAARPLEVVRLRGLAVPVEPDRPLRGVEHETAERRPQPAVARPSSPPVSSRRRAARRPRRRRAARPSRRRPLAAGPGTPGRTPRGTRASTASRTATRLRADHHAREVDARRLRGALGSRKAAPLRSSRSRAGLATLRRTPSGTEPAIPTWRSRARRRPPSQRAGAQPSSASGPRSEYQSRSTTLPPERAELRDEARRRLPAGVPVLGRDHRATPAEVAVGVGPEPRRRLRAGRGEAEVVRAVGRGASSPAPPSPRRGTSRRGTVREVAEHDVLAAPDRPHDDVGAIDLDEPARRKDELVGVRELGARRGATRRAGRRRSR